MFTVVAERINCTRKFVKAATEARDAAFITEEVMKQVEAGATYIDVNAGSSPDAELDNMTWLLGVVQAATKLPITLDSPSPAVLKAGLEALDGRKAMINSISLEEGRAEALLPLVVEYNTEVIGLCMGSGGRMPNAAEERCEFAGQLIAATRAAGIADSRVHIDPLVRCVSAEPEQGAEFLKAIRLIHAAYPEVHFCAGISNVSFGLPQRTLLNRAFLSLAIWEGLDGAIIDPTDRGVMAQMSATLAVVGQDEYCMEYLTAAREGLIA
ncbi:MAG TPA: dihydropteroate synthase [Armatimonadota bacterium]|nr:dihydropteroate synthase [Armatimonadota bacterium]